MDIYQASLEYHRKLRGKISIEPKARVTNREELSLAYTPGVAEPCRAIAENPEAVYELTGKGNTVAVITDGSAVLGLGDIGAAAGLPVMEGKCVLFKEFAGIDAVPILLNTRDVDEVVQAIAAISPSFGAINLEDIAAPRCFEIENRLSSVLPIPVMHDDQHGTAIVILAGLINAMTVVGKKLDAITVVVNGVGAAGVASMRLLKHAGVQRIIAVDSHGVISALRDDLTGAKRALVEEGIIVSDVLGTVTEAITGADVFIGVSKAGALTGEMVRRMSAGAVIFALANPTPEIMPDEAKAAGAALIATGRSDFPNQINNALVYPGVFRGLLDGRIPRVTTEIKLAAASALAQLVTPSPESIIPDIFNPRVVPAVAAAVKNTHASI